MRVNPPAPAVPSIDVAILTLRRQRLGVLCRRAPDGPSLPWSPGVAGETMPSQAARIVREALGVEAPWLSQTGVLDEGSHPGLMPWSVGYASVFPGDQVTGGLEWRDLRAVGELGDRHARLARDAADHVRARMDLEPVAFRLLGPRFTLTDLQLVYEVLLGHPLHKAGFRRALQATRLVVATDEWITGGVGRPAQLYRLASRRGRRRPRPVRLDLL